MIDRKLVFCPRLQDFSVDELIRKCPCCNDFLLYCCSCSQRRDRNKDGRPCHHFRLVFTDGACRNNGQFGATAEIGYAIGQKDEHQHSYPVTAELDPGQRRTSQRAGLLAALAGLRYMAEMDALNSSPKKSRGTSTSPRDAQKSWVVVADSEYVVKGMTEWLPTWKVSDQHPSPYRQRLTYAWREIIFERIEM